MFDRVLNKPLCTQSTGHIRFHFLRDSAQILLLTLSGIERINWLPPEIVRKMGFREEYNLINLDSLKIRSKVWRRSLVMSFVSINFKFKPTKQFDAARQIWSNLTFKKLKVSLVYWIFYIFEKWKIWKNLSLLEEFKARKNI